MKYLLLILIFSSTTAFSYTYRQLASGERPDCSLPYLVECNDGVEYGVSCHCGGCPDFCADTCSGHGGMATYTVNPVEEYRSGKSTEQCSFDEDKPLIKEESLSKLK
jgi:hypothetical protein